MRVIVLCMAAIWAFGCGSSAELVAPSTVADSQTILAPDAVTAVTAGIVITGPANCAEASTLPAVIVWDVRNLPPGTNVTNLPKGYHHDDTVNCEATEQNQRTQNSHLRVDPTGPNSIRISYDRDTNLCRGRDQIDVGAFFGRIIKRSTGFCEGSAPPPVTVSVPIPVPPTVSKPTPAPPKPPVSPKPEPSDPPKSHDKPKCNEGVGNGSEGCDPGKGNQGKPSNDEGPDDKPGNPGRKGGHK